MIYFPCPLFDGGRLGYGTLYNHDFLVHSLRLSHENDEVGAMIGCLPEYPAIKGVKLKSDMR